MSETFQVLMNLNAVSSIFDSLSTQYPFAVSKWLNALANDGQAAMRARLKDVFSLRRVTWNIQGIKIAKEDRASKTSWRVVIQVAEDRDYLNKFEELGYHIPRFNRYVWIPNEAVFGNRIIDRGNPLHPKNLQFQPFKNGMERGNESTYMLRARRGPVVFQHTERSLTKASRKAIKRLTLDSFAGGQGPRTKKERYSLKRTNSSRLLWSLVDRVKVPTKLEFITTITQAVNAISKQRWDESMAYAIRTMK